MREAASLRPVAASPALIRTALFAALLFAFFTLEVASFPRFAPVRSGEETVWRATKKIAQNQVSSGIWVRWNTVPAVTERW
jgi:hypothetical protein